MTDRKKRGEKKDFSSRYRRVYQKMEGRFRAAWHGFFGTFDKEMPIPLWEPPRRKPKEKKKPEVNFPGLEKKEWIPGEMDRLLQVKRGAFGTTCVVQNKRKEIALEKQMMTEQRNQDFVKEQVKSLHLCKDSPLVLKMMAFYGCPDSYILYLETFRSLPMSDLDASQMEPWMLATVIKNTGKALRYIHKKGITHRNLTGQNILINDAFTVKLTGFELATLSKEPRECVGTVGYMAPELIPLCYRYIQMCSGAKFSTAVQLASGYDPYSQKADYYTLGVTLFVAFFNKPPAFFDLDDVPEVYRKDAIIFNMRRVGITFPVFEEVGNTDNFRIFKSLIEGLLLEFPEERLSGKRLKNHPVLKAAGKRPPGKIFTCLESYIKAASRADPSPPLTVWCDPNSQYVHGDSQPQDMFFYLASRPSAYPFWQGVIGICYPEEYEEYRARQQQVTVSTALQEIELAGPGTDSSLRSNISAERHEDNVADEICEDTGPKESIIEDNHAEESVNEDKGHEEICNEDIGLEESLYEVDISFSLQAITEDSEACITQPSLQNSGTDSATEDPLITVILWICFITLCIIFAGKTVYNMFSSKFLSKNSEEEEDHNNEENKPQELDGSI